MEIYTQDDFIVAVTGIAFRDGPDDASLGFLEFIKHQRTHEEKDRLVKRAEKLANQGESFPTPEKMKELSEIFLDLPKDDWELVQIQENRH